MWSEYREEATGDHTIDTGNDSDSFDDAQPDPLSPEDWEDWHSRDLLNMWMSIQEYLETYGLRSEFLQVASFNDFCTFVHDYSLKSRQV